VSKHFKTEQLI